MNFGESVLFAAIMTMLDEMKSQEKTNLVVIPQTDNEADVEFTFNPVSTKNKLCQMAQELFDEADAACGTKTDVSADEIVCAVITGVIYKAVYGLSCSIDRKKSVYEFSLDYCKISNDFQWEFVSSGTGELVEALSELTDMGVSMVVVAANKAQNDAKGAGFIKTLSELMLFLEAEIKDKLGVENWTERLPIIVLENAIGSMRTEMERIEKEEPSVVQTVDKEKQENLNRLLSNARSSRMAENMSRAAAYYGEVLKVEPNNWEAVFYSEFCSVFTSPERTSAITIQHNTSKVSSCVYRAMELAKLSLFSQMERITELGDVATLSCRLASNYFVASMNAFNSSNGDFSAVNRKTNQVYAIIQMVFAVGDAIEKNFSDDIEVCKNLVAPCWKIGFDCYENCNMPIPDNIYDYYLRVLKYDPSFRCAKPLTGGQTVSGSGGGCYIATAVYGSYDCPQVWTLRRYRDFELSRSRFGRVFIRIYYAVSPTLVKMFGRTKWFNILFRSSLDRFTARLKSKGYEDTPYKDRPYIK